jgi:F0F1-type ATP synthase membrane subunit a
MRTFFRIILASVFAFLMFGVTESTVMASEAVHIAPIHEDIIVSSEAVSHTEEHSGPHIPAAKGDVIEGWSIGGLHITNTVFSTWIFMAVLFVLVAVMYTAIRTDKIPRMRAFGLDIVNRIYIYAKALLGDDRIAKSYIWLLGGLIVVIFLGNLIGLIFDWFVLVSRDEWLGQYLRPIYSDLSTTLVFSTTVILIAQLTAIYLK